MEPDSCLRMVRSLACALVRKGHGSASGPAASRFPAMALETTGGSPPPKQGRLKGVTSGPLSLRREGAGPCEPSNQGSRRSRTCGRRAVDAVDGEGRVRWLLCGRASHPQAPSLRASGGSAASWVAATCAGRGSRMVGDPAPRKPSDVFIHF
ncbi:uncharacterized protein LOC131510601 isoform X6 [Neofelis nebulosa]|uniref:uncharacterized protein LOC131510601 isoform X6 n=1 Tax=Neofelis nebulosa TaxID=61452 RepID=UPI00272B1078|nr:uncharacterized protein LOC131510601 isoform X6 [Neofelis nebulosa]